MLVLIPGQTLPLSVQKPLVAQVLVARSIGAALPDLASKWIMWHQQVTEKVINEAFDQRRVDDDNICIIDHIKPIVDLFQQGEPVLAISDPLEQEETEFTQARQLWEEQLQKLRSHAGQLQKNSFMHVDELLGVAIQVASNSLVNNSPVVWADPPIRVSVDVSIAGSSGLNGGVRFPSGDSRLNRASDVSIALPKKLIPRDYCRSLYTLFHEIFVHTPQAAYTSGQRRNYDEECRFTEGLVDAAAACVLIRELNVDGQLTNFPVALRRDFVTYTEELHKARAKCKDDEKDQLVLTLASRRFSGQELFRRLVNSLGEADAIRIVIGLNLHVIDHRARIELFEVLNDLVKPESQQTPRKIKRLNALRAFALNGQWPPLAQEFGISRL